jgi:hypothetical protein
MREANDILEPLVPITQTPPAGIDGAEWKTAMDNLIEDFRRRKSADGYLTAVRWLKAELDRTPADVVERWKVKPAHKPE